MGTMGVESWTSNDPGLGGKGEGGRTREDDVWEV